MNKLSATRLIMISRLKSSQLKWAHRCNSTSTVDAENVKVFSDKMNEWWEVKGPLKALHELNKLRVPFVINGLKKQQENVNIETVKILDVGCGGGILSEGLAKEGANVTGIDASQELIYIAKQHSKESTYKTRPNYICSTIEEHVRNYKNHYDGVVASEVIEHVHNKELFVKSCVETLKPGGKIFFTAPNKTRLAQVVVIWFGENVMNSPVKGSHQYEMFISVKDLEKLLQKYNCETTFSTGLALNMFTNKWSWKNSKSLFFALEATKMIQ